MAQGKQAQAAAQAANGAAERVFGTPLEEATTEFARRNPLLVRGGAPGPPPGGGAALWREAAPDCRAV